MRIMDAYNAIKNLFDRRTGTFTREGHELSERDNLTVLDAYTSFVCVLVDLGYLDLEERKSLTGRIVSDLRRSDIIDVLKGLAESYSLVQTGKESGFKALICSFSPTLWHVLESDVMNMSSGCAFSAKRLLQVTAWMTRLSLQDVSFEEESIRDYLDTEDAILDSYPDSITDALNRIIRFWLRTFDPDRIRFKHGSGSVAFTSPPTLETKYRALGTDRKIEIVFKDLYTPHVETLLSGPADNVLVIDRRSETTFVPKSWKSMRTISMESPTLMYLQQGILAAIDHMVESNSYLRNRIGTHEQERNQKLAQEASLFRNYATIDLSAASDSVSWKLVKKVFKGTPLYPYLIATRSTHTILPDGREVSLRKYAPMGSALCFPIETMVFAAICELVTRRWQHNCAEAGRFAGRFSVYGDDIICPTECAEDVIDVLRQLGFRVNAQKSFWKQKDWYRESCGGEYIDGIDVTPMRLSRNYKSECLTVNVKQRISGPVTEDNVEVDSGIAGYVDGANFSFEWGFPHLRAFFIKKLVDQGYTPIFGDKRIKSFHPSNYHTERRHHLVWCNHFKRHVGLQRLQVKGSTFVPMNKKAIQKACGDPAIAYRHWLEQAHYRQIDEPASQTATVMRPVVIRKEDRVIRSEIVIDRSITSPTKVGPPPRMRLVEKWITV